MEIPELREACQELAADILTKRLGAYTDEDYDLGPLNELTNELYNSTVKVCLSFGEMSLSRSNDAVVDYIRQVLLPQNSSTDLTWYEPTLKTLVSLIHTNNSLAADTRGYSYLKILHGSVYSSKEAALLKSKFQSLKNLTDVEDFLHDYFIALIRKTRDYRIENMISEVRNLPRIPQYELFTEFTLNDVNYTVVVCQNRIEISRWIKTHGVGGSELVEELKYLVTADGDMDTIGELYQWKDVIISHLGEANSDDILISELELG